MICRPVYFDAQGHVLAPQFYCADQSHGQALLNAISGYTHSGLSVARFTVVAAESTATTPGTYSSIYDAAELNFNTLTSSSRVRIYVPAPASTMFKPDQETVDPSAIGSLISAVLANATDPGGVALYQFTGGVRRHFPPAR